MRTVGFAAAFFLLIAFAMQAVAATPVVRSASAPVVQQAAKSRVLVPSRRQSNTRVGLATQTGTTFISESFSASATTPNGWRRSGPICLTAGNATTPGSSLPACGTLATEDSIGQGALQLTNGSASQSAMALWKTPLPTAGGLQVTFNYYSFGGTPPGSEGLTFFLTDASKAAPTAVGQNGAAMGYAGGTGSAGIANAYVGVGLDEYGNFSNPAVGLDDGPGQVAETIAVRGAANIDYEYLGGVTNAAGVAASLPFALDQPKSASRPSNVPTIRARLTPAGVLSVAIDRHDGNGYVGYYSQSIVGVGGQPTLPANVYFGLSASTGSHFEIHQISGLVVSALSSTVTATPLLSETFANSASTPSLWQSFGDGCLTAGTTATPKTSVPSCGVNAPQDVAGSGTVELTRSGASRIGGIIEKTPLPTANGLQFTFTEDTFNGSSPGGNGIAMLLTDASAPFPTRLGKSGAALGYEGSGAQSGVPNAYLGIGFEDNGTYSSTNGGEYVGGVGIVPESVAVRGTAANSYPYIGGVTNAAGVPVSLPFALDAPTATTRPAAGPTVQVTLTPSGLLTVAIDGHNGNGFVTYYNQTIVGVAGQPAVPANVYFGLSAATGSSYEVQQISNLSISTLGASVSTPASDNNPPQVVSVNGNLTFNVSAQPNPTTGNPQFAYNGSTVPPTLRLLPGDTLVVNLTNNLPVPAAGAGYNNNINLHYHGLHVSPQAPGDDSIDMLAAPGQSLHYSIALPLNHPTGLYWYHTHAHAEAERETLAGMSGALIVDGIAAYMPQVANVPERVLVVRDTPLAGNSLPNADLAQIYAMKWAMQHGVAMHAARSGLPAGRSVAAGSAEFHASSTAKSNNSYARVNPKYRSAIRPLTSDTHCVAGSPELPVLGLTLNGQSQPSLRIAPGEQQFWRVVNAGADTYLDFAVDNTKLQIIALDGVPLSSGVGTPTSMTVSDWVLPPASRAEFLITGPPAGTTSYVRTNCFDAGSEGNPMPAALLATINPAAASAAVRKRGAVARIAPNAVAFRFHTTSSGAAAQRRSVRAIRSAAISATRTLYYSDQYTINGIAYDPAAPPQFYTQTGSVEQWTIVNNSAMVHTFHIHQVHFLVQSINGAPQPQQYVLDNVNVPPATDSGPGTVTLLVDFTDPTIIGTFLLHCHILSHEDAGMMAKIRVGIAPPLTLSASNVTFAGATSALQKVTVSGGTAPYSVTGCAGVASAAVSGGTVTIAPAAVGGCVLTIADASAPSITTTVTVTVSPAPTLLSLVPQSTAFVSNASAPQTITVSGGVPPYSAAGCTSIASAAIAGATLTVTPLAAGACSLAVTDSNSDTISLPVSVNSAAAGNPLDNLTFHQNAQRTGWYQNETALSTANVNAASFGLLATLTPPAGSPALSKVFAQPLFVTNERAVDGNTHNLVIVAGTTDQIYAFDETSHAVVWHRDFTNTAAGILAQPGACGVIPYQGIVSTPVIDRALDRLFVVVATVENGVYYTRIHAIALSSGVDVVTPTALTGTVALATGGTASVSSANNMSRAALLEANGNIYVGLGSHCDLKSTSTHGWMLAYNAKTLTQDANIIDMSNANDGSNYFLGAIWMSGYGPAADAVGNIYFGTGNGPFNGTSAFAMSVLEVPGNLDITRASYFTPAQEAVDSLADEDLGSGGVMVLPDQPGTYPHIVVAGGKCSANNVGCFKYLLNRDNLGGQQPNNAGAVWAQATGGGMWGGPAYFVDSTGIQHILYGGTPTFNTYNLSTAPVGLTVSSTSNTSCLECEDFGSQPIVSSSGTNPGTAVAWAIKTPTGQGGALYLEAFDAVKMGAPLFTGLAGQWIKPTTVSQIGAALVTPLVADGRVYVETDGGIAVFGLTQSSALSRKHARPNG